MDKEELHNHIKDVAEYYISNSWNSFLDLDTTDLICAGIGVGKIIASEQEKRIEELEKENAELREELLEQKQYTEFKCNEFVKKKEVYEREKYLLTKVKEIIKKFLLWENDWHDKTESKYELLKQAEKFLSEVEK